MRPKLKIRSRSVIWSVMFALVLGFRPGAAQTTTTLSTLEATTGWDSCTSCAGGGANALYSMTQGVVSPSLNGNSTKFWVGGTTPYSHGLWWNRLGNSVSAHNFTVDMYYLMPNPTLSQGLEFAANQAIDGRWYKWSTQCSFKTKHAWAVYDAVSKAWVATSVPCVPPVASTWTHVIFEYQRTTTNMTKFVSISVNGQKYYINKQFAPLPTSSSGSYGVHFQLNGDKYQDDYSVYVNKMKLTYW